MLSKLEREFAVYAQSFFTGEESIDRNLRLKLAHSFRVRNEMRRLAQAESFSPEETRGALRTALLHDLSRFEQFQRFHSFNDAESFDHGDRSAELAASGDWLEGFGPEERDAILTAIRVHNKLAIPPGLPELPRPVILPRLPICTGSQKGVLSTLVLSQLLVTFL